MNTDTLSQMSQPSPLSQTQHLSQPVTESHNHVISMSHDILEPGLDLGRLPGGISLADVAGYLKKGNAPTHLSRNVLQLLADLLVKKEQEEFQKRNLKAEVMELICDMSGDISVTECDKALQLVTKRDKANLRQILHRLCEQKILKKQGHKAGVYHIIDRELEVIDWQNADTAEFDLELPLDLGHLVKIMPKNLIVIAGAPNSGKTAFLLNIVRSNMFYISNRSINYFSSEMSEAEFRTRIEKFNDPPPEQWRFNAYNRCGNFADVIRPDDVNIIDFLEIHDEFWKVGGMMRDIYEQLDKGIAIIALQKQKNAAMGRGGIATLEKPRLYLSMDAGKITIEKGKNWRYQTVNPNGMSCLFKLVQGCKFIKEGDWRKEEK